MCLFSVSPAGLIWSDRNSTNSQSVSQETKGFRCRQHHHRCSCLNDLDEKGANLLLFMGTSQRFGDIKGNNTRSSSDRGRTDGRGRRREEGEKGKNWREWDEERGRAQQQDLACGSQKAQVISPITALLGVPLDMCMLENKATQTHTSANTRCSSQSFQTLSPGKPRQLNHFFSHHLKLILQSCVQADVAESPL